MSRHVNSTTGCSLPLSHPWILTLGVGLGLITLSGAAQAASGDRLSTARANAPAAQVAAAAPVPLIAVVSINDQKVTLWSADGPVARSSVSTGASGHRTPTGVFSVIGKERYHESNLYSAAPMPFMQRITWSGIALHAGHLPGYPASHGCIRMPEDFAQRIYGITRTGMRVIVTDRDTAPFGIAHSNLPAPTFVNETLVASLVAPGRAHPGAAVAVATPASAPPEGRMHLGAPSEASGRLLNPMERGKLEQGYAKAAALEAQADVQALLDIAAARGVDARIAAERLRAADGEVALLVSARNKAVEVAGTASSTDDDRVRSSLAKVTLEAAVAAAAARRDEARSHEQTADAAAFQAAAEAKAAIAERDALEHAARVAERATEPVSIFVSRKLQRVYVRQGFEPVFEADVEIADAQDPLGTHVFTAVAPAVDGSAMNWVAVSVPDGVLADEPKSPRLQKAALVTPVKPSSAQPATAANALARVKFADDVLQKISEKVWTGASLIISDYGLSEETGKGTDFVVLTRSASARD